MKKTLIAILALGGMAVADDVKALTFATESGTAAAGGTYYGLVLTLSDNARLDASLDYSTATSSNFQLTSIEVQVRSGYSWGNNTCMYIVDGNKTLVAMSEGVTANVEGGSYVTFTFAENCSLITTADKNTTNAPLTLGGTYYAYFCDTDKITGHTWNPGIKGIGEQVQYLNSVSKQLQVTGQFDASTASMLTLAAHNEGTASIDTNASVWAPVVSVTGNVTMPNPDPVPEPATGSLSLLALAGLCARRRRK